jgi:hypothetical protein
MRTALLVLAAWVATSLPWAILIGRFIEAGKGQRRGGKGRGIAPPPFPCDPAWKKPLGDQADLW